MEILSKAYYRKTILFTLFQAFISAIFSILIGLPGAYILANKRIKCQKLIGCIYYLPFVLPSILLVLGFVIFFGNNGYLNTVLYSIFGFRVKFLYSFSTIILAHVFYNFPIAVSVISNSWKQIDSSYKDAASSDGASSFYTFRKVTLPFLKPAIASAFSLIFLYCLTSFAIILVLGGSTKFTTTEVEIYRQAKLELNINKATTLAVISLVISLIVLKINTIFENKIVNTEANYSNKHLDNTNIFEKLYLIVTCSFISLPLLSIVIRSFGASYKVLFQNSKVLLNTLVIGLSSSILGTILALSLCLLFRTKLKSRKLIQTIGMLPLATSSVIIGLSYVLLGNFSSFISIILAHSVIVTPFAFKTLLPSFKSINNQVLDAASSDGANQFNTFTLIELPNLKDSIKTSLVFSFAISAGELNSTILLGNNNSTIPVLIYRMVASYNYQGACVFGTILLLICVAVYITDFNQT